MDTLPPELKELNIITLNCWGLLHISAHRSERLLAIGQAVASASPAPHIVGLQECWTQEDYRAIRRETRYMLPYGKFYHSGAFGSGLAILSRWPIEESSMFRYPLNGRPTSFWGGDWYVGKGVACARIRYGRGKQDVLEVFNTHTDTYAVHRLAQAWEMAKLVRAASERRHLAIALGDFNDVPLSLPHRVITAHAPVRDVWRVLHPDSSLGAAEDEAERARRRPVPTALFNVLENGVTSDGVYNTWRWPWKQRKQLGRPGGESIEVPPDTLDTRGKRLDYIFVTSGAREGEGQSAAAGWVVKDARVSMMKRHATLDCSLSDHFSVEATLLYHKHTPTTAPDKQQDQDVQPRPSLAESLEIQPAQLKNGVYLHTPTQSEIHLPTSPPPLPAKSLSLAARTGEFNAQLQDAMQPVPWLPSSTYDDILTIVADYMTRERFQRRWRGLHFFTCILVTLVCWVGVWWAPNYLAFILMLLSSLGLVAGVVDGLVALLFVGTEMHALMEFQWEIMNAKASACGVGGIFSMEHEEKGW